jgi:hypothetical protein
LAYAITAVSDWTKLNTDPEIIRWAGGLKTKGSHRDFRTTEIVRAARRVIGESG